MNDENTYRTTVALTIAVILMFAILSIFISIYTLVYETDPIMFGLEAVGAGITGTYFFVVHTYRKTTGRF